MIITRGKIMMKSIGTILTILVAGIVLGWCTWVSTSIVCNKIAIAQTKTEMASIANRLDRHYVILEEIRDNQRKG